MSESATRPAVCYNHQSRESHIRCHRCDRFICPECMREAAVGFQCPECVRSGNKSVRQATTVFGGRISRDSAPVVTLALMFVNIAVYLGELQNKAVFSNLGMVGRGLTFSDPQYPGVYTWTANNVLVPGAHPIGVQYGDTYRLFTGMFVHALPGSGFGIFHILLNMIALWQFGPFLEHYLGRGRFLALYLTAGLGGSACVYLLAPDEFAFGASGAIFGLAAAYFLVARRVGLSGGNQVIIQYVIWMVIASRITSWQGHLGGLVVGLIVGAALVYAPRERRIVYQAGTIVATLLMLAAVIAVKTGDLDNGSGQPRIPDTSQSVSS